MAISISFVIFINHTVTTEDSAAAIATGNPYGIVFCDISHSGIILMPDANWLKKMTTTNKVKAMVSGDMFIHIPVYLAVLIIQVIVYVTLKCTSSYFDLRNIIPCSDLVARL